jgi:hypothetical protein
VPKVLKAVVEVKVSREYKVLKVPKDLVVVKGLKVPKVAVEVKVV